MAEGLELCGLLRLLEQVVDQVMDDLQKVTKIKLGQDDLGQDDHQGAVDEASVQEVTVCPPGDRD